MTQNSAEHTPVTYAEAVKWCECALRNVSHLELSRDDFDDIATELTRFRDAAIKATAAPDLLEALEGCLIMIGRLKKHCQITDGAGYTADGRMLQMTEVEDCARAAIQKATGK